MAFITNAVTPSAIVEAAQAAKPAAVAGEGQIYTKLVGGKVEVFYEDEAGLETQLSGGGEVFKLLWVLRSADMTSTSDQAFTKEFTQTNWKATYISAIRKSGAYGVSCLGGIYVAASKAGTPIVAATQTWAGLTGAGKIQDATLAAIVASDAQSASALYLSLTTGNTGALTADLFVYGLTLD